MGPNGERGNGQPGDSVHHFSFGKRHRPALRLSCEGQGFPPCSGALGAKAGPGRARRCRLWTGGSALASIGIRPRTKVGKQAFQIRTGLPSARQWLDVPLRIANAARRRSCSRSARCPRRPPGASWITCDEIGFYFLRGNNSPSCFPKSGAKWPNGHLFTSGLSSKRSLISRSPSVTLNCF